MEVNKITEVVSTNLLTKNYESDRLYNIFISFGENLNVINIFASFLSHSFKVIGVKDYSVHKIFYTLLLNIDYFKEYYINFLKNSESDLNFCSCLLGIVLVPSLNVEHFNHYNASHSIYNGTKENCSVCKQLKPFIVCLIKDEVFVRIFEKHVEQFVQFSDSFASLMSLAFEEFKCVAPIYATHVFKNLK